MKNIIIWDSLAIQYCYIVFVVIGPLPFLCWWQVVFHIGQLQYGCEIIEPVHHSLCSLSCWTMHVTMIGNRSRGVIYNTNLLNMRVRHYWGDHWACASLYLDAFVSWTKCNECFASYLLSFTMINLYIISIRKLLHDVVIICLHSHCYHLNLLAANELSNS